MKEVKTTYNLLANGRNYINMVLWYIPTKICIRSIHFYSRANPANIQLFFVRSSLFNFDLPCYDSIECLLNLKYDNTNQQQFNLQHEIAVWDPVNWTNMTGDLMITFEFTKPEPILPFTTNATGPLFNFNTR